MSLSGRGTPYAFNLLENDISHAIGLVRVPEETDFGGRLGSRCEVDDLTCWPGRGRGQGLEDYELGRVACGWVVEIASNG